MSPDDVFISHSSKDDAFVKELRLALEGQGLKAWVDSRELAAGNKLKPEIERAIEQARNFIVVLSPHTINSPWVRKEIKKALEVEKQHQGYKVIPLLLPDMGLCRSNLALTLIKLQRYDEARCELYRAVECMKPYGHAAKIWVAWNILCDLEQAIGNAQAAAQARQQAIESYYAYRGAGGESQTTAAQLCDFAAHAISQDDTTELKQALVQFSGADALISFKLTISKLQAILKGNRDPALADDPNLYYQDAVEIKLLLKKLNA